MANNSLFNLGMPAAVLASVMGLIGTDAAKAESIISIYRESAKQENMPAGINDVPQHSGRKEGRL